MTAARATVAVIGGGITGLAIAFQLLTRGVHDVVVLERGQIGGQAMIAYAGLLSIPGTGRLDDPLSSLGMASLARFPDLVADLRERSGVDPELRPTGALYLAMTADEEAALRAWLPTLQAYDARCRWVDQYELRELEPAVSPLFRGAVLAPFEWQVLSPRLVQAYARALVLGGGRILEGTEVTGVEAHGDQVVGIDTSAGRIAVERVVLAAGAWCGVLGPRLFGVDVPVGPLRGQLLRFEARELRLRHSLYRGELYIAQKADGTVAIGSTEEAATFDRRPTGAGVRSLATFATDTVPALEHAVFLEALAGLRPLASDGLPLLGQLPGWRNVWIAAGHARNGVLLSTITGVVMAECILGATPTVDLHPFDPARLVRRYGARDRSA
ncbi:MAG: glycine oxidase ThiO [Thermorudis peleae]|nr:glycine oxidase ThiO [Thermorudis peleae]